MALLLAELSSLVPLCPGHQNYYSLPLASSRRFKHTGMNSWNQTQTLTPMSNQERISPHNINKILSRQVMRIQRNIIQGITWWIQYPILKTNVLRIVEQTGLFYFAKRNDMKQNQARYNETKGIIKKDVFHHFMSRGQRKSSESPWGIKPQTFGFRTPMLYHWATGTPWASVVYYKVHITHILHTARISNVDSIMVWCR